MLDVIPNYCNVNAKNDIHFMIEITFSFRRLNFLETADNLIILTSTSICRIKYKGFIKVYSSGSHSQWIVMIHLKYALYDTSGGG